MTTEQRNKFENERRERYLAGASVRNERIDFCLFRQGLSQGFQTERLVRSPDHRSSSQKEL